LIFRLAQASDALELQRLNDLFNGEGCNEAETIRLFLESNNQEIVCVAVDKDKIAGFCCGQVFKSMCYSDYQGEITELYVLEVYRRQGIARELTKFMEAELIKKGVKNIRVLTGGENIDAQNFYKFCGYDETDEIMLEKSI
jgi:ribosomal protein S18 acetylase RimI-like enzyme